MVSQSSLLPSHLPTQESGDPGDPARDRQPSEGRIQLISSKTYSVSQGNILENFSEGHSFRGKLSEYFPSKENKPRNVHRLLGMLGMDLKLNLTWEMEYCADKIHLEMITTVPSDRMEELTEVREIREVADWWPGPSWTVRWWQSNTQTCWASFN